MELAVLDACVLFQGKLTDFLLCLAEQGAFDIVWSDAIHDEWVRNVHIHHGIPLEKLEYRRSEMERSFPAANCAADPWVLAQITGMCQTARQKKDAHVIATGVAAQATVIVTHNIPDFSGTILNQYGLTKAKPDDFCQACFQENYFLLLSAARAHRASMTRPPYSPDEYLDLLRSPKMGLRGLANMLMPHKHLL